MAHAKPLIGITGPEKKAYGPRLLIAAGLTLAGARFVHFATHGIVDEDHPDFSGLALSGPVLQTAKVGVLGASLLAAVLGMVVLVVVLPKPKDG